MTNVSGTQDWMAIERLKSLYWRTKKQQMQSPNGGALVNAIDEYSAIYHEEPSGLKYQWQCGE